MEVESVPPPSTTVESVAATTSASSSTQGTLNVNMNMNSINSNNQDFSFTAFRDRSLESSKSSAAAAATGATATAATKATLPPCSNPLLESCVDTSKSSIFLKKQQKRLQLMQQARTYVNQCQPKERKELIKRLKHKARVLLTPLEKKILKVIYLRQQGLEKEIWDQQDDAEMHGMAATLPQEDQVITWSRSKNKATKKKKKTRSRRTIMVKQQKKSSATLSSLDQSMNQLALWSTDNMQSLRGAVEKSTDANNNAFMTT